MNISISQDPSARMSSRDIAETTGKLHNNIMRDIQSLIDQGVINSPSFGLVGYVDAKGETRTEYLLDFQATMVLVTGYDTTRLAAVVDRWLDLGKGEATPAYYSQQNYSEELRLAADQAREEFSEQRTKLSLVESKTEALDRFVKAEGSFCLTTTAKCLQVRPKVLIVFLSSSGWICKRARNGKWTACEDKIQQGLLEYGSKTNRNVRVTAKGFLELAVLLHANFAAA